MQRGYCLQRIVEWFFQHACQLSANPLPLHFLTQRGLDLRRKHRRLQIRHELKIEAAGKADDLNLNWGVRDGVKTN